MPKLAILLAIAGRPDTLSVDSAVVADFKADPDFNYTRDIASASTYKDDSFIDYFFRWIERIFDSVIPQSTEGKTIWLIIAIMIIAGIIAYMFINKVGFFAGRGDDAIDYEVADDIYSIDFDSRINEALRQRNYRQATRLTYLKTLRWLADNRRIDWALFKTPLQYTREETNPRLLEMTNEFLRIRYGNFDATEQSYLDMHRNSEQLIDEISKQIIANQNSQPDGQPDTQTDGGNQQ